MSLACQHFYFLAAHRQSITTFWLFTTLSHCPNDNRLLFAKQSGCSLWHSRMALPLTVIERLKQLLSVTLLCRFKGDVVLPIEELVSGVKRFQGGRLESRAWLLRLCGQQDVSCVIKIIKRAKFAASCMKRSVFA